MSNSAWRYPFQWPLQGEILTLLPECCPVMVITVLGNDVRIIMPSGSRFIVPLWSLYRDHHMHRPMRVRMQRRRTPETV